MSGKNCTWCHGSGKAGPEEGLGLLKIADCKNCNGSGWEPNSPATELSGGGTVTEDHKELKPNGQQKGYVVLTAEERTKGFVRPVRKAYQHVGVRPKYPVRALTPEETERYARWDYDCFEPYPESESPVTGRFWSKAELQSGCGTVTTMARDIAETFARDPKFYGGGFCYSCRAHFPNEQFVWEGTNEIVGS